MPVSARQERVRSKTSEKKAPSAQGSLPARSSKRAAAAQREKAATGYRSGDMEETLLQTEGAMPSTSAQNTADALRCSAQESKMRKRATD